MSEHQQTQQSKKPDSTFQKQATLTSQSPVSHPASIIQCARIDPKSLTPADVLQLQRTIGNRAVGRLLSEIRNPSKVQQALIQRQEIPEEEEPLQGKMIETIQRREIPEEEEPLQGKFENKPEEETCPSCMQRQEIPEEEPLQGKMIETVQRQEIPEEEEPLQGKMSETIQRQEISEEEEPLQGKFDTIQRLEPEEKEKLQMKSVVQRQEIPEEEEPLQGKMIGTIQRQEIPEEEEPLQGKFESIQRQEIPEEEPLQKKSENNTGMPDNLKAGVENLSGIDMRDVRVHYNSNKPAHVGALAYTQGTDIHVAPGQERHLPHEAWHVVQQKQDHVKPTLQMKGGVQINDDRWLEQEADTMGQRVFQSMNAAKPVRQVLTPHRILQRKVMQLIATQIKLENNKIAQVIIRGRPERVFSNSMGDHTTAFIVQQEGLNIAFQNQTIPDAINMMEKLSKTLKELPGYKFMKVDENGASTTIGKRFLEEFRMLTKSLELAKNKDKDMQIHYLQIAVNAYLSARELIPFSTINLGEKSKGKAGHGHGESAPAAVLSEYERTESSEISDDELANAVYKLFDYQSAGMLSSEKDTEMVSRMTAGISLDSIPPKERLELIWEQHEKSIETMFPKVFAKIKSKLESTIIDNVIENMEAGEFDDRNRQVKALKELVLKEYQNLSLEHPKKILGRTKNMNMSKVGKIVKIYEKEAEILSLLEQMREINLKNRNKFSSRLKEVESEIQSYVRKTDSWRIKKSEISSKLIEKNLLLHTRSVLTVDSGKTIDSTKAEIKEDKLKYIREIKAFAQGGALEGFTTKDYVVEPVANLGSISPAPNESSKEQKKIPAETLVRSLLPMAVQVELNEKGEVSKMISSGRPNSPFSHSMGAHSTAWVVHLDRAEKRIVGKKLPDAITEMRKLGSEVLKFAEGRKEMKMGDKAKESFPGAKEKLDGQLKEESNTVITLQDLINAILSFYNLIPGVSRDKIDTGGKGEGTYRRILLNYEKYGLRSKSGMSKEDLIAELNEAINGMYDSTARSGPIWDNHKKVISQAYPDAYAICFEGAEPKMEQVVKVEIKSGSNVDEDEGIYHTLDSSEESMLEEESKNNRWLWGLNNCLINAITDAAGIGRANAEQVVSIRKEIGAPVGEMLFASPRVLNIILKKFELQDIGVIVIYMGSSYVDMSPTISDNPLFIYHDGINHFDKLPRIKHLDKMKSVEEGHKRSHDEEKSPVLEDEMETHEVDEEGEEKDPKKPKEY